MNEPSGTMVTVTRDDDEAGRRPTPPPGSPALRYWPGLDGMRALAVVAVVVYHLAPGVLPGGFLGVDLFFVISGYLITTLITDEWRRRGRVGLVQFWGRRIRRLYPAVLALVAVLVPVTAAFDPAALATSRVTIVMALVYMTNWWFIFHHVSYFQRFGPPPMLLHLWSLAIEEQYYLLWPPVLVLLLRSRWGRPNRIAALALGLAAVSVLLMGALYGGPGSLNRVYYGSDTHAFGLLVGSALGLAVPPTGFATVIGDGARRILDRAGGAALGALVALMFVLGQGDTFTWRGGLLLAVVASGVAVVVAAHPGSLWSRALGRRPVRWVGARSYSIYIWHWPVIVLTEQPGVLPMGGFPRLVVRVAAILALSSASYRFVEQPWRRGRAQAMLRRVLSRSPRSRRLVLSGSGAVALALVALVLVASAPPRPPGLRLTATPASSSPIAPGHAPPAPETDAPSAAEAGPGGAADSHLGPRAGGPVLAIGDSVLLSAYDDLHRAFGPKVTVDAVVGRQPYSGLDRLAQYRAAGRLQDLRALVVALGSNGAFSPADLVELRRLAKGVPLVVLVNVRVPDPWGALSNATISSAAHLPGYKVVDWYAASGKKGVLYPDHVHPDLRGQRIYTRLVVRAITGR